MSNATELAEEFKLRGKICKAWENYYTEKDKYYKAKETYDHWNKKFMGELEDGAIWVIDASLAAMKKFYEDYIVAMSAFHFACHQLNTLLGNGPRDDDNDLPF
jgi:hypothetical protein